MDDVFKINFLTTINILSTCLNQIMFGNEIILYVSSSILFIIVWRCWFKKQKPINKRNGPYEIDFGALDIDFYKYISVFDNHNDRGDFRDFGDSNLYIKVINDNGYCPFLDQTTHLVSVRKNDNTMYYIYSLRTNKLIVASEMLYNGIIKFIKDQTAKRTKISYHLQYSREIFLMREIPSLFSPIQRVKKDDELVDAAFKNFYHRDKESIAALIKAKLATGTGGIFFFTGVSGTGKTQLSTILQQIYYHHYDRKAYVYCDAKTNTVSVLEKLATGDSMITIIDEFDKMIQCEMDSFGQPMRHKLKEAELKLHSLEEYHKQLSQSLFNLYASKPPGDNNWVNCKDLADNKDRIEAQMFETQRNIDNQKKVKAELELDPKKQYTDRIMNLILTKLPAYTANGPMIIFTMNDVDKFIDLFDRAQQNLFRDGRIEKITFYSIVDNVADILSKIYGISGSNLTKLVNAFTRPFPFSSYASIEKCMGVGRQKTKTNDDYKVDEIIKFIDFNRRNQLRSEPIQLLGDDEGVTI